MKHELHRMTWKEAEAAFQEDPVVIIPLGSMEQHGPHGPMGDYQAAAEVALRVAKTPGLTVFPPYLLVIPNTSVVSRHRIVNGRDSKGSCA